MPTLQSAPGAGGDSASGTGSSGAEIALAAELERLRDDLVQLNQVFEDLRTKYNAHVHGHPPSSHKHTENLAATYTQNALSDFPPAGTEIDTLATPTGSQVTTRLILG